MFVNNFSTLLKGANAEDASVEARKNMLNSMINSGAQDSGWGTLEVFLVKLCSLFSERCKSVNATFTEIQRTIDDFKDNRYRPVGQDLLNTEQSVFKLWLAARIYHKLGADMHFQVNIDADRPDSAQLILSGQPEPGSQSIWTNADLYCVIDITVVEAEIFKALAGDVLPQGNIPKNPYANSLSARNVIQQCLHKDMLTETQITLAETLIGLSTNGSSPSMKLINRANDALKKVSDYIKKNNIAGLDSDVTLDSATFHEMYTKTTPYTMEDFLTVSLPVIAATEMIGRETMVEQTIKFVGRRISALNKAENNVSEKIKSLILDRVDQLKEQAFGLAEKLYVVITVDDAKFEKDKWECSLNKFPSKFQGQFREFMDEYNKCQSNPSQSSYEATVNLLIKLQESEKKILSSKLNEKRIEFKKMQTLITEGTANVNDKSSQKSKLDKQLEQQEEQYNTVIQNKEEKDKQAQNIDDNIKQLEIEVKQLSLDKGKKKVELNELKSQKAVLQQQLTSYQQDKKEALDACCSELKNLQEKVELQRQRSTRLKDNGDEQTNLSNRVLAKAKSSDYANRATHAITRTGDKHNISLDEINDKATDRFLAQEAVVSFLNSACNPEHPYDLHDFNKIIHTNNLVEIEENTVLLIKKINEKELPPQICRINDDGLKTFLMNLDNAYINREIQAHHGVRGLKRLRSELTAKLNSSFNDRLSALRAKLNSYITAHNAQFKTMSDRAVILKSKQEYVKVLFNTVKSMNVIKDQLDKSLSDLDRTLNSDKVSFFNSMPEDVKILIQNMQENYQSAVERLVSKKEEFQSRTERLLNIVLPKLITSDGEFLFNYENLESSELTDQDINDIRWCEQYIEDNSYSDIAEHQMANASFSYNAFVEETEQCKQEFETLKSLLKENSKKYEDSFDEFQKKIIELNKSIENNEVQQQTILNDITQITTTINEKTIEITEQKKQKDSLQKEIFVYTKNIKNIEVDNTKIKREIVKLNDQIAIDEQELSSAKEQIDILSNDISSINQLTEKTQQKSVQSISVGLKQSIESLDYQLKNFQRGKEFLSAALDWVNDKKLYEHWIKTGQAIKSDDKDYNGMIFNGKIPYIADKEESMKIWNTNGYHNINVDKDRTKVRTDAEVAKDVIAVGEANQLLEKVQMKCFDELFAIENNPLINEVHDLLKDYVGKEEKPDFKSFSKYIEHCYSAINSYRNSQQSKGVTVIDSAIQQNIEKLEVKLYKAQVLFGIYIAKIYLDPDFKAFRKGDGFSADIIGADIGLHIFSQVYNHHHDYERQFSEPFNEWDAKNKNKNKNDQRDDKPIVRYLNDVLKDQIFLVSSAIKTGRVIAPEISSDFVAPSLQYVIKLGAALGQEGIDFLFGLTDVASGALVMDYSKGTSTPSIQYEPVFKGRKKWIIKNDAFKQLVAQTCNEIGLNVNGLTTPGESSAVA